MADQTPHEKHCLTCNCFRQLELDFLQTRKIKFGYDENSERRLTQRLELICYANQLADILLSGKDGKDEPCNCESKALQTAIAWRKLLSGTRQSNKGG